MCPAPGLISKGLSTSVLVAPAGISEVSVTKDLLKLDLCGGRGQVLLSGQNGC